MIDKLYEELNSNTNNNLIDIYLRIQEYYQNKYGDKTVVFIEIGSFFEIYQDNFIGKAKEVSDILNIQLTRKNKSLQEISKKNPYMAGIPNSNIDKYVNILMKTNEWNIVLINQKKEANGIVTRYFDKIISPGINNNFINSSFSNYLISLYIEENAEGVLLAGIASTDVTTGKSLIKNIVGHKTDKELALDEINSFLSSINTNEIIIEFRDVKDIEYVKNKLKIENTKYLVITKNNHKIKYINKLFSNIFEINSFLTPIEELDLERETFALQALVNICEFIIEHDINLAKKLKKPIIIKANDFLELGNNALEQLNIINANDNKSVFNVIDNTSTSVGKRELKYMLTNPIIDKDEINNRHILSKLFVKNFDKLDYISQELYHMYDMERLLRKISINTIHPYEISYLYNSVLNSSNLIKHIIEEFQGFEKVYKGEDLSAMLISIKTFLEDLEYNFDFEEIYKYNRNNITGNFLNNNKFIQVNKLIEDSDNINLLLKIEIEKINTLSDGQIKFTDIKIKFTDMEGYYLEVSRKKFDTFLKSKISDKYNVKILKGNVKIFNIDIDKCSDKKISINNKIIMLNKTKFEDFIVNFDKKYIELIEKISIFVANIDVYKSCAMLIVKNKYIIPDILESKNSFLEFEGIRHSIIETIEDNGLYIPNNLSLGDKSLSELNNHVLSDNKEETNGVLLYGINSSGKSSLNKSIGICVILAQAGLPVPADNFRISLFNQLYTRITGNDDIYKGLSTFAVEMKELKNILNRSNDKCLILGDEISHGTETISGLSIVASAIKILSNKNSIFMFSTHLHQLVKLKVIESIPNLKHLHLSVHYDDNTDTLIYDRTLKMGSGSNKYGLEFAKSINMDKEFLNLADKIRREITDELDSIEILVKNKTRKQKYNKEVIFDECSFCSKEADDIHHINEQQYADKHGMIDHFHKNNSSNLLPLCKKHHKLIHKLDKADIQEIKYLQTNTGIKLFVPQNIYSDINIEENKKDIISF
jgi:DNA mismatch repair protein MutS